MQSEHRLHPASILFALAGSMKAFALPALLLLGGCSTVEGWFGKKDAMRPADLVNFAETAKSEVRWHADLGDSGASVLQPALTSDAIYGASGDGALTRIERATGKQDVRSADDAVESRLASAIAIVKEVFGLRVVYGNRREGQHTGSLHCPETLNAGSCFFSRADNLCDLATALLQ